jgi:hypothetical protein
MTLSLWGRLAEVECRYCEMPIPSFLRFARDCGFRAVELRATQIGDGTTPDEASRSWEWGEDDHVRYRDQGR